MNKNDASKIPQSVIESLARATLAAMRREKDRERSSGSEASGYDKITNNEEQTRPAQRAKGSEK